MSGQWRAYGQDPTRPGRVFEALEPARRWAEEEAPRSCGWSFVENVRTGAVDVFRAETGTWNYAPPAKARPAR